MAKGHKHLKKLKSEKAKVKLKGSAKFLPKGTNVTDTNFKVKQIVVREQLKAVNDTEFLSKRKLNVKELLSRLQHYNTTVRTDAINDLKQLVTVYPTEIVVPNLCQLIQGVSHLVLDKEKTVRRESLKLIALILNQVSVEQVEPFFDVLSSYFRCAMTHIDPAIQEDSLLLLDTLLQFVPSLVAANSDKILENFFDLISKLRTDSKPGRTLTVNLGSKMTAVKWRIKVLSRLYHMLAAIVNEKERHGKSSNNETTSQIIKFKPDNHNTPIYNNNTLKPCILKLGNFTKSTKSSLSEGENNIMKYVDVLVPLLFETWLEVGPNGQKENSKIDVTLTEEAVAVLNSILNIFQLLYTFIKIYEKDIGDFEIANNFISKFGKDFSTFIFAHFPYTQIVSKKRKRNEKIKNISMESSCIAENLMICHIFCTFNKKLYFHEKRQKENVEKMLAYLENTFSRWTPETDEQNKHTTLILKNLLLDVSKTWSSYNDEISNILKLALALYKQCPNIRPSLFSILCEIVHYNNLNRLTEFQIWLSTLPNLLCQSEISEKTVDMMSLLARQKNALFINSLKTKFPEILNNLTKLNITDTEDEDVVKCKILSLIYFIKSENMLEPIKIFIDINSDSIFNKYFKEILILKYETTNDQKNLNMIKNF